MILDMKKSILITVFMALALLYGCSDFLEETAYDKMDIKQAYSTPTLVYLNGVASIYTEMGAQGCAFTFMYDYLSEISGDLAVIPGRQGDWVDGGVHEDVFTHRWSTSFSWFNTTWNDMYKMIGLCNQSYDIIQELIDAGGEDFLTGYQYEIRAIRAYYYYQALNLFGRVPIVTSSQASIGDVVQPTRSEVYEFLRDELAEIIPNLPVGFSSVAGNNQYYGRMTKAVGYMMMAKLAINAPVFSEDTWNDGKFTGGIAAVEPTITNSGNAINITLDGVTRNAWETVVYCKEQVEALGYSLSANFKSNFLVGNEGSKENIFVRPNDISNIMIWQNLSWYSIQTVHAQAMGYFGGGGPSATLKAAYLFGNTYDEATETPDYSNADPRWDMTCFYDTVFVDGNKVPSGKTYNPWSEYLTFWVRLDYDVTNFSDEKGLYIVKWGGARVKKVEIDRSATTPWLNNADFVVYRYADLLLLAAEAKYRLGATGEALDLVNEVRDRVDADPRITLDLEDILDERALELMWEPTRREDLVRFGMFTEPTLDRYVGVPHANVANDWVYDATGYTTVFPIPTSVLNLNSNLTQNPGY
jgi:hypothetical protein